jgi:probable rRNA maturation factor
MPRRQGGPQHPRPQGLDVQVAWSVARAAGRCPALLKRVARGVAGLEGVRRGSLSIAVVGARRMTTLHRRHSGVAGPTDVLTFDLGGSRTRLDGEIVVCVDVAARRAAQRGIPLENELALYVAHGLLHLCGYDDHTSRGFARMHAREDVMLSRLGLGPVFASGQGRRA